MSPPIAIIMRAKDEMPYARETVRMLEQQTGPSFNLFAIDSGSTDGTLEVLKDSNADLIQIPPESYVPGSVLNTAIDRINHQIVVLLNADAIPQSDDWLEKLVAPILEGTAEAAFSKQVARPDADFIVAYDYMRAFDPEKVTPDFFSAVACAFKRSLWERFKFIKEGYAEDAVWARCCTTFGAHIQLVPDSVVEHSHNYSFTELYRKKFRHGESLERNRGENSLLKRRLYLWGREVIRDLLYACREKEFRSIPHNIAYRTTIHAGLHQGIIKSKK